MCFYPILAGLNSLFSQNEVFLWCSGWIRRVSTDNAILRKSVGEKSAIMAAWVVEAKQIQLTGKLFFLLENQFSATFSFHNNKKHACLVAWLWYEFGWKSWHTKHNPFCWQKLLWHIPLLRILKSRTWFTTYVNLQMETMMIILSIRLSKQSSFILCWHTSTHLQMATGERQGHCSIGIW